jgi:GNAT superfamily N-acetyltransferase
MTASIAIREAVEADGVAIGEAHCASWLAAYGHIFDADFLTAAAESRRTGWPNVIRKHLVPPQVLLVAEFDGRVVAFAHALPRSADVAEITGFYCHPDAWGTGVSAALMSETKRTFAATSKSAFLWTLRDAARAHHFYEKVGFGLTGNTQDHPMTNWTTGVGVACPAVEYAAPLAQEEG